MSFSYDPKLTEKKWQVRFLVEDTDRDTYVLEDEEIDWLLSEHTDVRSAAVASARRLTAHFARQVSKAVGDLRIQAQQRFEHYQRLVRELSDEAAVLEASPRIASETDRGPSFSVGMHDHPSLEDQFEDDPT